MPDTQAGSVLTDGTGISKLTGSKLFKDFVVDFLIGGAAALTAVNITGVDQAAAQPAIVVTAVGGALIRSVYRFVLKWAST